LKQVLQKRSVRTASGVAVITILTKPFECPGECVFCPQERAGKNGETLFSRDLKDQSLAAKVPKKYRKADSEVMPKSYFSNEPAASRALLSSFDPFLQVKNRLKSLAITGHDTSKIELIILGGTFSYLPKSYRTYFVTRALQALNGDNYPTRSSLKKAQEQNEQAAARAIAIVVETRPDYLDQEEVAYLRRLGVTKVELGVQSLNSEILKTCMRGHSVQDSVRAIELLREAGFKIGIHLMPGLPGASLESDYQDFVKIYNDSQFKPDFLKIYPCTTVPFSELAQWQQKGEYEPFTTEQIFELMFKVKKITPRWVRISRLIRDIPATSIVGGSKVTNLRQLLEQELQKRGESCQCIRCREVKKAQINPNELKLAIDHFMAAGGEEYFLTLNTLEDRLAALLRLRIPRYLLSANSQAPLKELRGAAIIRELHTYGQVVKIGSQGDGQSQHSGLGRFLVDEALDIIQKRKEQDLPQIEKLSVISGIGVKQYWRRLGFNDDGSYLSRLVKLS
jgi:elongator complex protein 3